MKNVLRLTFLTIVVVVLAGASGCKAAPSSTLDEAEVRTYADAATEITLQGLSESDLARYTQHGNAAFKAALTQEKFDQVAAQINSQLGAYQSKEFLRTEEQQGFILVHYKAKFAKGEAGIRMVFDKDHLVAGQWFE
jgi:outer membrane PBP1 activator LpoA protein